MKLSHQWEIKLVLDWDTTLTHKENTKEINFCKIQIYTIQTSFLISFFGSKQLDNLMLQFSGEKEKEGIIM